MKQFHVQVLLVIVASSYVTLGVQQHLSGGSAAGDLWWVYGGVSFVLAVINLWMELKERRLR